MFNIKIIRWIFGIIKKYLPALFLGFVFAVLCFVVLEKMMKPVSLSGYCGTKCHEMNTAYRTWELSDHGSNKHGFRVECVDCHLPPKDEYFRYIAAKTYAGAKDTYKHYFGEEYNVEKTRTKVLNHIPSRRCLYCHDDLLARPGSPGAEKAHTAVLNAPDAPEYRCVTCHENAGHERQNKLFSPQIDE